MAVSFHRGLTSELRMRLTMVGIRLDEIDAQLALGGMLTREVDARTGKPVPSTENKKAIRSIAAADVEEIVEEILTDRHVIIRAWEEAHPGEPPFPPLFAETILRLIAEEGSLEEPEELLMKLKQYAESELMFG